MNIAAQRLIAQGLASKHFTDPADVVRHMCAMQAQDYGQALWGIGVRTQNATLAGVEKAIEQRKILRTWPMRGTIHFVAAEDARWMVGLSAPRKIASDKRRQEQLGITSKILEQSSQVVHDELSGDKQLARSDILQKLKDAGIKVNEGSGYHILWYLAQTGHICIGPTRNKQQTFALLNEWAPKQRTLNHDEALAELAGRYIASHGPATTQDFIGWSGLTATEAKAGLQAAGLKTTKVEGSEYWLANNTGEPSTGTLLLPGFDEYYIAYRNRSVIIEDEFTNMVVPGKNGIFKPMVVVDGQVVGIWKRAAKKDTVHISLEFFKAGAQPDISKAIERYGKFLGLKPIITP